MLDGWHEGELVGSGTVIWRSRRLLGAGRIDEEEFIRRVSDSAPSLGHCNTMGTRLDDEFAERGARNVIAWTGHDAGALS